MPRKSFLIVTASIGSGHVKAAEAVAHEIKTEYADASIRIVDFMSGETSWLNAFMKQCYLTMLAFVPNLYEFLYNFTGGHAGGGLVQGVLSTVMKRNMASLVRRCRPDVVVCTHPFPAGAASSLKGSGKQHFLFATVITDYSVHQMWVYHNVDVYFVARAKMQEDLAAEGIPRESVVVSGIPVERSFGTPIAREAALQALDLRADWPVVLIMGGGLGLGGMDFALAQLEKQPEPLQILVVAGRNQALLKKVQRFAAASHHQVRAWGYTDQVRTLMSAASFLISKPGALTITEALTVGLPVLLHEPIPGPETDNAVYMSECGTALWIRSDYRLAGAIAEVLHQPEKLAEMRQQAAGCRHPQAAAVIVAELVRRAEAKDRALIQ